MKTRLNVLFIIIILFVFLPLIVNAEGYPLGDLKIGQRFESGDIISRNGAKSKDLECLNYLIAYDKYPHLIGTDIFGRMYGINFYFDDEFISCSGSCFGVMFDYHGWYSPDSRYMDDSLFLADNNKYWKLEKYEELSTLEAAAIYFKSYEKQPNLIVSNHVNNMDKYTAKKGDVLKYSINIKNIGEGKSTDNTIITNVPDGLLILEDKISDNGIYDQENNTIKWNYELLRSKEEYTFNYFAKVIDNNIMEYIGKSYIISSQVQEKTESDNTIVNIEKKCRSRYNKKPKYRNRKLIYYYINNYFNS